MSNLSFMGGFNANDHEEQNDNSPLPAGEYYIQLESGVLKDTANGQGKGFNATFDVLGDAQQNHAGRKLFVWFNLQHTNETAQKIGQAEFAALCKAVGVLAPNDTDELLGKPFLAKVAIDKKDNTRNVIRKYSAIDSAAPAKPAPEGGKLPWE